MMNQPPRSYPAPSYPAPGSGGPPPPTTQGYGGPAPLSQPKPVQFFSLAGGSPVPVASSNTPPTASGYGAPMPPPPVAGPPTGMGAPAPPTGLYNAAPMPPPPGPGAPMPSTASGLASSSMDYGGFNGGSAGGPTAAGEQSESSSLPLLAEVDANLKCSRDFMRMTVNKVVNSQALSNASRVPLGLIVNPMAGDKGCSNDQVPLVDFGSTGIVRCKRCRTYINPFVVWMESGRRWKCNICGLANDTPTGYYCHVDHTNRRRDRDQRPELSSCSVEFLAPADYQVRPPQPPTYLFLIDVSSNAAASGMISSTAQAIKNVLNDLPGNPRTQIGFLTFDSTIHFYSLKAALKAPQMFVISDLTDIILPLPEDLIVNLQDSRAVVEAFLDALPNMFQTTEVATSCTGSVLAVARHLLEPTGGKLCLFQSTLPSLGEGSLKLRENPRLLGTDKEHTLLSVEDTWYKNMSAEFNKLQIAVDTFLFSPNYTDVASLATLSKTTAGSVYYYPSFLAARDGVSYQKDLEHVLTRATAFEAVMRVRATRGLRITNFHGNFFIRGQDLLSLPNCTSDSVFGLDFSYDDASLNSQIVTIQAALLYTSSTGERRIRVHNMLVPVVQSLPEMLESVDIDAVMNLLSKQAVEIATKSGLENARQRIHQTAVEIFKSIRSGPSMGHNNYPGYGAAAHQEPVNVPAALQLLPLYAMSLQKSVLLRGGSDIRFDERAYYHQRFLNASVLSSKVFIYPRLFSLHDITEVTGLPVAEGEILDESLVAGNLHIMLPSLLNLSFDRLSTDGVFLLENSVEMIMWIGRGVNPYFLQSLFGVQTLDNIDMTRLQILYDDSNDYNQRINHVIAAIREDYSDRHMQVHFVREGDSYAEAYFARFLVEDRASFPGGTYAYTEYYGQVMRAI